MRLDNVLHVLREVAVGFSPVIDDDVVIGCELAHDVRADESGAADDENSHCLYRWPSVA